MNLPPQNLDAEEAILGAMFINPKIKPAIEHLISESDFSREANQHIFTSLLNTESDIIAVKEDLIKRRVFEKAGGPDYIESLIETVATSAGYKFHCKQIKDASIRRQVIHLALKTAQDAHDPTKEVWDTLDEHKSSLRGCLVARTPDFIPNRILVDTIFKDIEQRKKNGNQFVGVRTGFKNLDSNLYGLEEKTTTYLIARPSIGKTALAINIADNVAMEYSGKVLFFSLESGDIPLTRRRLSAHSGVYLTRLRTGNIDESRWSDLIEAANVLSNNNLIILDNSKYKNVEALCSIAETLALEYPVSLVIIDHIQRMNTKKKLQNRHLELSYISERLTSLTKDLNIPSFILCQLSRQIEQRKDQRPKLSDMKESGDLEQNADCVLSMFREEKESEYAEIECLKGRDIGTFKTWLKFDRWIQKFYDCEDQDDPYARIIER